MFNFRLQNKWNKSFYLNYNTGIIEVFILLSLLLQLCRTLKSLSLDICSWRSVTCDRRTNKTRDEWQKCQWGSCFQWNKIIGCEDAIHTEALALVFPTICDKSFVIASDILEIRASNVDRSTFERFWSLEIASSWN